MVGKIYRVVFTRYAQNRRREAYRFEERINGKRYAKKIQQHISEATRKLEKLPEIHPLYEYHDSNKGFSKNKFSNWVLLWGGTKPTIGRVLGLIKAKAIRAIGKLIFAPLLRRSGIPKRLNTRYYIIYESKRMKSSY
ncbi:MAG: hypothetical protein RIC19_13315 [Phaeodactylibacter sp.]|uniref:hypothetical protein n=1 Tax=Phaeodactylibacter sp. TaxID=1940289 RepID=UPI0032EFCDB6